MAKLDLEINIYGDQPVLTVTRKDGHKLRIDGDYMLPHHTSANDASVRAYKDSLYTWEELAEIVKDFLGE